MNRYLLVLVLCGYALNAQATCPKRLTGKYVSSVEYMRMRL